MGFVFESVQQWQDAACDLEMEDKTLYDLDGSQLKSASKIEKVHYVCLQAVWVIRKPGQFKPDRWDLVLDYADKQLGEDESWQLYLATIDRDTSGLIRPSLPAPRLGTFSLVYYKQRLLKNLIATERKKVIFNTDYSPVSHRTRAQARAQAATDSLKTPVKQLPKFMTSSFGGDSAIGGSSMAGIKEGDATSDREDEEISPDMSKQTPRTRIEALSPTSPDSFSTGESTKDEAIVNSALVALLNAITIHDPMTKGHWTERRKRFLVKAAQSTKIYEAITDGHLSNFDDSNHSRIILEVKPMHRQNVPEVRRQETAQMAAWIFAEPNPKQASNSEDKIYR